MPKGYWIALVDIDDPDQYARYIDANAAPFAEYGARFVVRAGQREVVEGRARARTVVIEFPSYEQALACYSSPAYQAAKAIRTSASTGDVVIVEGYDGD
ncbi:MAG: DUF1330 domain-containing protein [Alphaproteobacteria bacterium]